VCGGLCVFLCVGDGMFVVCGVCVVCVVCV